GAGGRPPPYVPLQAFDVPWVARGVERLDLAAKRVERRRGRRGSLAARERAARRLAEQLFGRGVALQAGLEQVVGEREHAAARVVGEGDLARLEQRSGV